MIAHHARVLDQLVFLDDLEEALETHHVGEVPAPGGVDPGLRLEDVVRLVVDLRSHQTPAGLGLLAEGEGVGLEAVVLVSPDLAGEADAGLHFVDDEEAVARIRDRLAGPG